MYKDRENYGMHIKIVEREKGIVLKPADFTVTYFYEDLALEIAEKHGLYMLQYT